jgi:hypothetical protein
VRATLDDPEIPLNYNRFPPGGWNARLVKKKARMSTLIRSVKGGRALILEGQYL